MPDLHFKVCIWKLFFLFPNQNICCGNSKESSQWDVSFEHPKHMLILAGKKIITILRWNCFAYLYVWFCYILDLINSHAVISAHGFSQSLGVIYWNGFIVWVKSQSPPSLLHYHQSYIPSQRRSVLRISGVLPSFTRSFLITFSHIFFCQLSLFCPTPPLACSLCCAMWLYSVSRGSAVAQW